jgi:hypothetical protein
MRFAFWRSSSSSSGTDGSAQGLASAAQSALDGIRRHGGAMARLAERNGGGQPQFWIANSILHTVATFGRRPEQSKRQDLSKNDIAGLTLSDNMSALHAPGNSQPCYVELGMRPGELKKYLRWAKTVQ